MQLGHRKVKSAFGHPDWLRMTALPGGPAAITQVFRVARFIGRISAYLSSEGDRSRFCSKALACRSSEKATTGRSASLLKQRPAALLTEDTVKLVCSVVRLHSNAMLACWSN